MSYYNQVRPSTGSGWENNRNMIEDVAKVTGMPLHILKGIAGPESGWRVNAKNSLPGQTAKGLFQFTDGSWRLGLKAYGNKYGIPLNASALDPKANALMTAAYYNNEYAPAIKRAGRALTPGEVYAVHFLGGPEYAKFAKAIQANPHTPVDKVLRNSTLINNKGYLYHSTGKGKNRVYTTPRTVGELSNLLEGKMGGSAVDYGSAPIMVNTSKNTSNAPTLNVGSENSVKATNIKGGSLTNNRVNRGSVGYTPLTSNMFNAPSFAMPYEIAEDNQNSNSLLELSNKQESLLDFFSKNPMSLLNV